eukprot:sb/3469073/
MWQGYMLLHLPLPQIERIYLKTLQMLQQTCFRGGPHHPTSIYRKPTYQLLPNSTPFSRALTPNAKYQVSTSNLYYNLKMNVVEAVRSAVSKRQSAPFSQNLMDERGVPSGPLEWYRKFPILSRSLVMTYMFIISTFTKLHYRKICSFWTEIDACIILLLLLRVPGLAYGTVAKRYRRHLRCLHHVQRQKIDGVPNFGVSTLSLSRDIDKFRIHPKMREREFVIFFPTRVDACYVLTPFYM